jgi:5-methylcytosine-specific restriction enzyme A
MPRKDPAAREEYKKEYVLSHVEEIRARNAKYYKEHCEELKANQREYDRKFRRENPEAARAASAVKRARTEYMRRRRARAHQHYLENKAQYNAKSAAQYRKNPEAAQARHRRRKAGKLGNGIGLPYTRHEIFSRDKWLCQSCWRKVRDNVGIGHASKSTVDHIVPLKIGGIDCRSNVQTLCGPCNRSKHCGVGRNDQLRLAL